MLLLGDSGVGKTSLLNTFVDGNPSNSSETTTVCNLINGSIALKSKSIVQTQLLDCPGIDLNTVPINETPIYEHVATADGIAILYNICDE